MHANRKLSWSCQKNKELSWNILGKEIIVVGY